ncbi:MAG: hypothetical protein A3J83_07170 [Elusimicrobia bacterium RIFOXYA2_FULL_40_6]|nr:MAG: hypothetical protein A3J83_07170 [Elusimicrobia bacterium RIFOXYA2_FULL_40_6]
MQQDNELKKEELIINALKQTPKFTAPESAKQRLHFALVREQNRKQETFFDRIRIIFTLPKPVIISFSAISVILVGFFSVSSILDKMIALKRMGNFSTLASGNDALSTISLDQTGALQVSMNSQEEVKDVDFEIELPRGVCMVKSGQAVCEQKNVRWNGDLQKGENIVIIHVRGMIKGNWNVEANVKKNKSVKKIEIPLTVI